MSLINNKTNNIANSNTIPAIASSEHFNSLLQQARSAITCDSDCQYRKTSQELKDKYLAAQVNASSGQDNVETAKKNYVMFTQGESGYNDYLDTSLNEKADKISELFSNIFQEEISNTNSNIDIYNNLLNNYQNVFDLYTKYKEENIILKKELKEETSDIFTNERKTYYENEGILSLNKYYNILIIIYVITKIIFAISIFTFESLFSLKIKICIFIGLIILPFISSPILALIVNLVYKIYELLPKNVLKNL
jgi:archaellin